MPTHIVHWVQYTKFFSAKLNLNTAHLWMHKKLLRINDWTNQEVRGNTKKKVSFKETMPKYISWTSDVNWVRTLPCITVNITAVNHQSSSINCRNFSITIGHLLVVIWVPVFIHHLLLIIYLQLWNQNMLQKLIYNFIWCFKTFFLAGPLQSENQIKSVHTTAYERSYTLQNNTPQKFPQPIFIKVIQSSCLTCRGFEKISQALVHSLIK